jgi:HD-GYP domain-containing protein (c-di-GMP phosphodiesterase class II)
MIVPVEELKVGMFVEVPLSWHEHPFLKNSFLITSEEDIHKFKSLGIDCVVVDPARSRLRKIALAPPAEGSERDTEEEGVVVVPTELITSIKDQALPAEKKAQLVITHSITMMQKMLEKPTAQRIAEAKKGIAEIVNLILTDDNTTYYLLNITTHDFYTYTHSVNVGVLGVALAKALFRNSSDHDLQALGTGFFLHDLGKVKVPSEIINKPAALTEEEMKLMRRHPADGYKILVETHQLTEEARVIVLQHHERSDGTGYPRGLRKNEIHLYARLCTLADVYDALTSERPYKKKLAAFEALKLMRAEMLHHFQAELFEKFVLMFRKPIHGC